MKSFGQNLKYYRKAKNLSQKALAQALEIGQTTIGNYEKGIRFPSLDLLKDLSKVLEVSLDDLIGKDTVQTTDLDLDKLSQEFIELILTKREQEAIDMIIKLADSGYDVLELYDKFLKHTLYHLGHQWSLGKMSIPMEHHISSIVDELISQLASYIKPKVIIHKKALFIAPSNEHHLIGLKIVKETFRKYGWQTLFIGNSVPWQSLLEMIQTEKVDLVCISITMKDNFNQAQALVAFLKEKSNAKFMLGGQAFELNKEAIDFIQPDYYTNSKAELIDLLTTLL